MSTCYPPVALPNTEFRSITSDRIGQEYRIFVGFPPGYAQSDKRYPVLYMLDANRGFQVVQAVLDTYWQAAAIPECLLVGIGYPVPTHKDTMELRARDFTPTQHHANADMLRSIPNARYPFGTGGAARFLAFICQELIPFVETNYRIDPSERGLLGSSLSGLFALYTLFHQPNAFSHYLIGSPSLWWDDGVTFSYEQTYASKNANLAARVFMCVGADEELEYPTLHMVSHVLTLTERLHARGYPDLLLNTVVFEGETHLTVYPATVSRGLRVLWGE